MESLNADIIRFLTIGSGYGDGYGSGYGSGDGSGYGSGDGSGYGFGDGFGDGYGSGDGDGDGSGYGSGDGDIKTFNGKDVCYIDDTPTIIESVRGNYAKGYILRNDFSLSPCYIAKMENCFAHGQSLREAVAEARNKALGNMPIKDKIEMFKSKFLTLTEKHSGKEFYDWHHILAGSCTMGRDEFCKAHDVQMDAEYSVEYFLDLVSNAYGSEIIKQVRESYN